MSTMIYEPLYEPVMRSAILVVDDENGPRQALRMLLKEDHEVFLAPSVAEAQEVLRSRPIDLVITDIRMPQQSGVALLQWIKEDYPDIEVIILTGYGQLETAMKAVEYGAFAYMEKPFDSDVMLRNVREGLEKRHREQERRRLEQLALEANRFETVGRFVSCILHDLGTPLSVIGSQIELIALDVQVPNLEKRLEVVRAQSEHCSELVRKAMSFLRHQTECFTTLNINEIVVSCLNVAQPVLVKQHVQVLRDLGEPIALCKGDYVLMRQAVLNLVINACQAMEGQDAPREVHLRTWEDDHHVCLAVRDTGPGIRPENRGKVFQTFFTTKTATGTGLGLAAVKNIMHRHSGEVYLTDPDGPGASFVLRFPMEPGASSTSQS